ncbi:MAG: porphobilinogen synthase, partial [Campylobacter sp.]|nr:porphobilinogen synthase [Campylobacter sp.]
MFKRYRRLRLNESLRDMVRENNISVNDFIYPLFVVEGQGIKNEINSMPGVFQMSLDEILKECQEIINLGIKSIILFGIPNLKDSIGSDALDENGIIARSLRATKEKFPTLFVITDLCFCEYTDHGHCGILDHVCKSVDND